VADEVLPRLGGAGRQDVSGERPVNPAWPLCEVASAASNRPTFMQGAHFLGCGILGGPLRDFDLLGRVLGERIVSRLDSGKPANEEIPLAAITRTVFDGRQLERWRVPDVAIRVPGQISMHRPMFAADLSFLSAVTDRPVSLRMGNEFFDGLAVLFTSHDRTIQFAPSGTMELPADTPHLVLRDDRPRVEVMIAGRPAVLTVDLGFNGDIAVNESAWTTLGLNALPVAAGRAANANGRDFAMSSPIVGEVALGSTSVRDVKVTLQPVFPDDGDGFIGLGLLSRFTFALDVRARRLWLIAPEDPPGAAAAAPAER
jgi:hypothetical protein